MQMRNYICCHSHDIQANLSDFLKRVGKAFLNWAERVFKGEQNEFDSEYSNLLFGAYAEAVGKGFDKPSFDTNFAYRAMVEANLFRFSAAKTLQAGRDINALFRQYSTDYASFRREVDKLNLAYNKTYLSTEYDFAQATAQMGARHLQFEGEKDIFPYVQYQTVNDSRVRPAHKALDNKIVKIGTPEYDLIMPPLGWRCRCNMYQFENGQVSSLQDVVEALKSEKGARKGETEYDTIIREGFDVNRGKLATIFTENEMYLKGFLLNWKDYNLPKFNELDSRILPNIAPKKRDKNSALAWFNIRALQGVWKLSDYSEKVLFLTEANYRAILNTPDALPWIDQILNIVQNPSEVWSVKDETGYTNRYLRFYDKIALMVETKLEAGKDIAIKWFGKIGNANIEGWWRKGVNYFSKVKR
jgi:SPP1 gp7 family putative phage head morphogenesis protein